MKIQSYEKPAMKFVSLRNESKVANTCWGGHGGSMKWYYDTEGPGYVSFQIGGGSCDLNLINVTYYDSQGNASDADTSKIEELNAALENAGGNKGSNFKGEDSIFPTTPGTEWS